MRTKDLRLLVFWLGLVTAIARMGMSQEAPPAKPSEHPIKVITWGGWFTGYDLWDNQGMLKKTPKDTIDTFWYPQESTLDKLKTSDIIYVQNHGGVLDTADFFDISHKRFQIKNLKYPTSDTEGPSLILNWGCQNGAESHDVTVKKADGTEVTETRNLLKMLAEGFGVNCDSATKVYVAPKIDIILLEDDFQEKFFEEFSKGDVTVEEAARKAHKAWYGWGLGDPTGNFTSLVPAKFEEAIGICGNKKLTLNEIRKNLDERDRLAKDKPAAPPTSEPASPAGGVVSTKQDQTGWYCTNNPRIKSEFPPPPWLKRGDPDKPTSRDYKDMVLRLIEVLKEQGMDGQRLEEFMNLMTNRIWTDFPEEIAKRAQWEGRPEGLPDLKDKQAVDEWREKMAASFLAEYQRILASGNRDVFMVKMLKMGQKIEAFDPRAAELANRLAAESASKQP